MKRILEPPLQPQAIDNADLILCTHLHPPHMDPGTLLPMLDSSPRAKVVVPKTSAGHAHRIGIGFDRMTLTDSGLRIEYFKDSLYGRVYSVPSAHPTFEWTPVGGYPYLGYLIRFEGITIYHAGDTIVYDDLALRLRPFNVTVAILPIGKGNIETAQAAQLAEDIGAAWLVPMHYGTFEDKAEDSNSDVNRLIEHMLGHRPLQKFKIFDIGEGWTVPALSNSLAAEVG